MMSHKIVLNNLAQTAISPPKLTIEIVPKTCWFSNVRSNITASEWKKISDECFAEAQYCCEICKGQGKAHPVECHEKWYYDEQQKQQVLTGLIALCPACHEVKHIGLAKKQGRGDIALQHLASINAWTIGAAKRYESDCWRLWHKRNQSKWTLDISWLTQKNIKVTHNDRSDMPSTAIEQALRNKDFKIVSDFIASEFNYTQGKEQNTLLHLAILSSHVEMVNLVLKDHPQAQSLVNKANAKHITPLQLAVTQGNLTIVKCLIDARANTAICDKLKRNILHLAAVNGNAACLDYLLTIVDKSLLAQSDSHKKLPFHLAFSRNTQKKLLKKRVLNNPVVNPSAKAKSESVLFKSATIPCLTQERTIFDILLSYLDKDLIAKVDKYGKTVLHCLAQSINQEQLKKVFEKCGTEIINSFDKEHKTPLLEAAVSGNTKIIPALLAAGAEWQHKSKHGNTAFDEISRASGQEIAQQLFAGYIPQIIISPNEPLNTDFLDTPPQLISAKTGVVGPFFPLLSTQADKNTQGTCSSKRTARSLNEILTNDETEADREPPKKRTRISIKELLNDTDLDLPQRKM